MGCVISVTVERVFLLLHRRHLHRLHHLHAAHHAQLAVNVGEGATHAQVVLVSRRATSSVGAMLQ